jgi:imidazolonepropionase-like amidohydrolase
VRRFTYFTLFALVAFAVGCGSSEPEMVPGLKAFVGAELFDGESSPAGTSVIVVRDGRIEAVGPASQVEVPEGAEVVDLSGKYVTPGWIEAHGHVGGAKGLDTGAAAKTTENVESQLTLMAAYGVTSVFSQGGEPDAAFALRDGSDDPALNRARLTMAGTIVTGPTPEEARAQVDADAEAGVDWIKIRVDDNLGSSPKMSKETYTAVIEQAHQHGLKVSAHLYYLEDAKGLLDAGVDMIAHSVRDVEVDDELIATLKEKGVCLVPTLTREVSTFVYESKPDFFGDPFFTKLANPDVLEALQTPERQAASQRPGPQTYKKQLAAIASPNVKKLFDDGVGIAMGTDAGPPARFLGYFEHMELQMMVDAGLTPTQALQTATSDAAACLGLTDVGTLEEGKWADFVVFDQDPQADIANTKTLSAVYVAGNAVPKASPM